MNARPDLRLLGLVTDGEAARVLGCDKKTARRWRTDRGVPAFNRHRWADAVRVGWMWHHGAVTVQDLRDAAGLGETSSHAAMRRLVAAGLVECIGYDDDPRPGWAPRLYAPVGWCS